MLVERLRQAINKHDLDAFVACFDPDCRSEQPAHPAGRVPWARASESPQRQRARNGASGTGTARGRTGIPSR